MKVSHFHIAIAILFSSCVVATAATAGNHSTMAQANARGFDLFKRMKANTSLEEKDYRTALAIYKELSDKKPDNARLAYKVGVCYLNLKMKKEAITYLERAYKIKNKVHKEIHLSLGRAYHLNNDLDKAISEFELYKKSANESQQKNSEVHEFVRQCNFAKEQINNPKSVNISNLGATVNTNYPDYAPSINADETTLIFTSRRENTTGGAKFPGDFEYYEDIYISNWDASTQKWKEAKNISPVINTPGHDASLSIAPNGKTIYIFKNDENKKYGDIYESKLGDDNSWFIPKPLPPTINSEEYFESSASVTEDGKTLYFASERKTGRGSSDLYRSMKDANGEWGPAENLGDVINTPNDEICSSISADGKTLYFSSKGHLGMGGYDIFKSTYENGKWSTPENQGYPINSTEDDLHFVKAKSGNHAYFSSIRDNKPDRDLYLIDFLDVVKKDSVVAVKDSVPTPLVSAPVPQPVKVVLMEGQITNEKKKGVEAQLEFTNKENGEKVSASSDKSGKFKAPLALGKSYDVKVKSEGYEELSDMLEVSKDSTAKLNKKFALKKAAKKPAVPVAVALANEPVASAAVGNAIYFDSGNAKLRMTASKSVLESTLTQLQQDNAKTLELMGYSDKTGPENQNKALSQRRAQSTAMYFIKRGIDKSRIKVIALGSEQPAGDNSTKEGRKINRRVEIIVK